MANDFRRNGRGDIQLGSITPWSLRDLLDLVQKGEIKPDSNFECPVCDGHGKNITQESSIELNNCIDDHSNDLGYKSRYKKCACCKGTGRLTAREINFGFDTSPNHSRKGINLTLRKYPLPS